MERKDYYSTSRFLGLLLFIFIFSCTANKKVVDDEFATDTASEDSVSAEEPVSEDDLFAENSMSDAGTEQKSEPPAEQAATEQAPAEQQAADEFGDFEEAPPAQEQPSQDGQQAQAENLDELNLDDPAQDPMTPSAESLTDEQKTAATEPVPDPVIDTPAPEVVPSTDEPTPVVAETPVVTTPEPVVEPSTADVGVTVPTSELARISEVNFRGNENGGALIIKANKELQFTTRLNSTTNQIVLEVNNALIPKKLMRPLITKDMSSSIGTIDIYQRPNSSIARFVIQLRADSPEPLVQPEGDTLLVIGTPMFANKANQMGSAEVQVPLGQNANPPAQQNNQPSPVMTQDPLAPTSQQQIGLSPVQVPPSTAGVQLPGAVIPLQVDGTNADLTQPGLQKPSNTNLNREIYTKGLLSSRDLQDFLANNNRYYGKKISIVTQDLEVRDVLNFLSEEAAVNLIYDDDIAGKVSIKLRRVPWDQALVTLLKSKKLGYQRQGSILRIARLDTLLKEEDEAVRVRDARLDQEPLIVRNFRINYAEIATLETKIKEFITETKKDAINRGRVSSDTRTNTIIVTETPTKLKQVEDLIQALDTQPQQVQIEARIIEASESFSKSVGTRWGLNNGKNNDTAITAPFDRGRVSTGIDGSNLTAMPSLSSTPSIGTSGVLNTALWLGRIGAFGDLELNLSLGQVENKIKVLSSPRIVVLSGTSATVNQTVKVNVPDESTTLTGSTGTQTSSIKTKSVDAGVTLNVTPQISNIDTVRLKLGIIKSVISNDKGDTSSRNANTEIILKSMQTAVIGGVFESQQIDGRSGVPGLQDVPVLGALFRGKTESSQKSELMIFVTPKILPPLNLPTDTLGMVPAIIPPAPPAVDSTMNSVITPEVAPVPTIEPVPDATPETTTEEELSLE